MIVNTWIDFWWRNVFASKHDVIPSRPSPSPVIIITLQDSVMCAVVVTIITRWGHNNIMMKHERHSVLVALIVQDHALAAQMGGTRAGAARGGAPGGACPPTSTII